MVQNYIGLEKDARSKSQLIIKISGIIEWSLLFITQHHTFITGLPLLLVLGKETVENNCAQMVLQSIQTIALEI